MSETTHNSLSLDAIMCALLEAYGVTSHDLDMTPAAGSSGGVTAHMFENFMTTSREALVSAVAADVVEEVTERLLDELPWRLAEEIRDQFGYDWVSEVATDLADGVVEEAGARLAEAARGCAEELDE